jgi:transcription elongation GreA/GreB family factor
VKKEKVLSVLIDQLEEKLRLLVNAALEARDAATNEESRAENKYDTRGLEASYLAGAQSKRAMELKESIALLRKMSVAPMQRVSLASLVQLQDMQGGKKFLYLVPTQGGERFFVEGEQILTVTPESPVAQSLMGKCAGDEGILTTKGQPKAFEIINIW